MSVSYGTAMCDVQCKCAVCECSAVAGTVRVRGARAHCTPQPHTRTVHCAVPRKQDFVGN